MHGVFPQSGCTCCSPPLASSIRHRNCQSCTQLPSFHFFIVFVVFFLIFVAVFLFVILPFIFVAVFLFVILAGAYSG